MIHYFKSKKHKDINGLLRQKKGFKHYLGTTFTLKKRNDNGFETKTLNFYSKTKTIINIFRRCI